MSELKVVGKGRKRAVLYVTVYPLEFESRSDARDMKGYIKEMFKDEFGWKNSQFQIELRVF